MLQWIRRRIIPLHHLVLLIEKDPLSGTGSTDCTHSIRIAFLVFVSYIRIWTDLSPEVIIKGFCQGLEAVKASTCKILDVRDNVGHVLGKKPLVVMMCLGVGSWHSSFKLKLHMFDRDVVDSYCLVVNDIGRLFGSTSSMDEDIDSCSNILELDMSNNVIWH